MILARFLQQREPYMIGVCFFLNHDLHWNILNTKPFFRYICGLRCWRGKNLLLIVSCIYVNIYTFQDKEILISENLDNLFETLVILISKGLVISKIYTPIIDYKMYCMRSNNLLGFDTSHGTLHILRVKFLLKWCLIKA